MSDKDIFVDPGFKSDSRIFWIKFRYDQEIIRRIKTIPGSTWNPGERRWMLPATDDNLSLLSKLFTHPYVLKIAPELVPIPEEVRLREQQIDVKLMAFKNYLTSKRYSTSTIRTYAESIRTLFRHLKDVAPDAITNNDLIRFNNEYILKRNQSQSFQNQVVNALKLYLKVVENKRIDPTDIHRPRREHRLPNVLSKEEVKLIMESLINQKHK